MKTFVQALLLSIGLIGGQHSGVGHAAEPDKLLVCKEGRLVSGQCVNEKLARSIRETTILMAQPKLSYTAPPQLPSRDFGLVPHTNIRDLNTLFTGSYDTP